MSITNNRSIMKTVCTNNVLNVERLLSSKVMTKIGTHKTYWLICLFLSFRIQLSVALKQGREREKKTLFKHHVSKQTGNYPTVRLHTGAEPVRNWSVTGNRVPGWLWFPLPGEADLWRAIVGSQSPVVDLESSSFMLCFGVLSPSGESMSSS